MINQRVFVAWLPIAIAATLILGTVYAAIQQNYRQTANDPQIQVVEDSSSMLERGANPVQLVSNLPKVDLMKSLELFMIIYDQNGKVLAGSGFVGSSTPILPAGVLESTKSLGLNKITWQLASGERFAAVIKSWQYPGGSGYVLAARSLREIEEREFHLEIIIGIGWILAMFLSLVGVWFNLLYQRKYLYKE